MMFSLCHQIITVCSSRANVTQKHRRRGQLNQSEYFNNKQQHREGCVSREINRQVKDDSETICSLLYQIEDIASFCCIAIFFHALHNFVGILFGFRKQRSTKNNRQNTLKQKRDSSSSSLFRTPRGSIIQPQFCSRTCRRSYSHNLLLLPAPRIPARLSVYSLRFKMT